MRTVLATCWYFRHATEGMIRTPSPRCTRPPSLKPISLRGISLIRAVARTQERESNQEWQGMTGSPGARAGRKISMFKNFKGQELP